MRRRNALLPTAIVAVALLVGFLIFTNIWTDRLWFVSYGYGDVFATMLWTRVALFAIFGVLLAGVVVANLALANHFRPSASRNSSSELLNRYRDAVKGRFGVFLAVVGVATGLFGGAAGAAQAMTYQAWRNGESFGVADPQFNLDISFFVFDYPWWRFITSFLFGTLVFTFIVVAVVYFMLGAVRMAEAGQADRSKLASPAAQAHLSILLGVALLVKALQYWLDTYGLSVQESGLLTGLTYSSVHASLNALRVLAVIAALCAVMFFANALVRRWVVPVVGLVLMLVSALVLQLIYPAAVQAFTVVPQEQDREAPYIERHIAATRQAYGVDETEVTPYEAETTASQGQLREDAAALPGIRLMDPAVVGPAFTQGQQVRGYYAFPEVLDIDRYNLDGTVTDAVVGVREIDTTKLDQATWNNLHTVYTHGYGVVAAYGNQVGREGEPSWIVGDIPPQGQLAEHEPRIYFGELHQDYSIVGGAQGSNPMELDTPGGGEGGGPKMYTYAGKGGVGIGDFFHRLLYAIKFADINILISERVNEDSKIIYDRTPKERVEAAAPWLTVDSNAYPAIVEGRVVWIVDGYTTSNTYPNSQRVSLRESTTDSNTSGTPAGVQVDTGINYIRNSVKAVVDAYDGTVTLYAWDEQDPLLKTWQKVFPDTVQPKSEIPDALLAHLRYPEDLFKVQRTVLGRYHVTDPGVWYNQSDLWRVPNDPVAAADATSAVTSEPPYYLSVRWPDETTAHFSMTTTFVPHERENLSGFMAVNADAASDEYGRIRILQMSESTRIDGPQQTFNAMTTNPNVAEALRPYLNQGSASASYGNLLTLPVGGGLIYVMPIYVQRTAASGTYPVLRYVVVRFGDTVGIGSSLQEALDNVFAGDAGADTGEQGDGGDEGGSGEADNPTASRALAEAQRYFEEADEALKQGDLATYQEKIKQAEAAMERARRALGG